MMPLLNLGFLLLISMTLFGGHYGAKRDSNTESRKPSLPPALRRHYFAARQNFHREPQVFDPYGGVAGPPPLPPPTANDYGRLKCSPIVRKCRRSPQPPADYPAADNNFPQSQSQWASASSSSSSAYSTAPPPSPPAGPTNIAFQQQPQPQSAYQQQLAVPSQSSQLPSNYQLQQQQQQPAEPTNNNDIDNNYQQQPTAAVVAAATSAQQLGGYQPPAQAEEQQPQTPPSSPAPPQQSYGEKPAPPAAATDYQTPSPPAPPADYEPQPATTRRRQRAITRKAEAKLETAPQSEEKNRCRNEWLLARQRSGRSSDGLQNKTNDPQQAHSSHIHEGEILNGENKARTHGRRTQVQRVSPLDALIGPEYNTARQQQGRRGGRNRNNNRGRGQRGRPGQIPFPPAADEDSNNEWAQVNRLHNQQQQQHQQQQLQQEQRYPIGPGQQKQPAAGSRRPVGTGPVGPVGQFPTDGGLQQQHQQQGPPFLLGGRENNPGAAGGGVGVLIGTPKGGRQPTLISTNGGRLGHIPSSSSRNLPYVDDAHRYYYPPRMPLPLPTCFHNPTGYPCCNPTLNDLMVETYTELESKPKFHTCNINAIAQHLQMRAEDKFNTSFETVAAFDDFAQKIHFHGDLVCKVELGGKYMLAYATVKDAARVLPPESGDSGLLGSGASVDSGGGGQQQQQNYQRQSVTPPAPLGGRRKRNSELAFGPQLPLPLNDLSRRYSIWI